MELSIDVSVVDSETQYWRTCGRWDSVLTCLWWMELSIDVSVTNWKDSVLTCLWLTEKTQYWRVCGWLRRFSISWRVCDWEFKTQHWRVSVTIRKTIDVSVTENSETASIDVSVTDPGRLYWRVCIRKTIDWPSLWLRKTYCIDLPVPNVTVTVSCGVYWEPGLGSNYWIWTCHWVRRISRGYPRSPLCINRPDDG